MGKTFTTPSSCCCVPGMSSGQPCKRRMGRGGYLYEVCSPLWDGGSPMVSALNLAHQDQAGRVTRARRARTLLTWSISDT